MVTTILRPGGIIYSFVPQKYFVRKWDTFPGKKVSRTKLQKSSPPPSPSSPFATYPVPSRPRILCKKRTVTWPDLILLRHVGKTSCYGSCNLVFHVLLRSRSTPLSSPLKPAKCSVNLGRSRRPLHWTLRLFVSCNGSRNTRESQIHLSLQSEKQNGRPPTPSEQRASWMLKK